jgi:hypothetical protein
MGQDAVNPAKAKSHLRELLEHETSGNPVPALSTRLP